MIKLLIIDRDGVITHGSSDPASPFYYILDRSELVLKPNVREAFSLLSALRRNVDLKVVMATRQRCISKGLISRVDVDEINWYLASRLGFTFDAIYVEEAAETKRDLFAAIQREYKLNPLDMAVIDDSDDERNAAWEATGGCHIVWRGDLYSSVCHAFAIS